MGRFFCFGAEEKRGQHFVLHCDEPIKVRLCGDNYDVDFTMSEPMKNWFKTYITLYEKAGALNEAYLSQVTSDTHVRMN